ncbi:MOSC domain-containing protein [Arcobacter roscoffensis]|uniref:MOSC domain-containing protein n=1 Tax=Arcobacter roscoffensis TaxID=2961520 RepID=A0ABY5E4B2_9BACT|nr:MOSC domain-containing protein [Arcobacter roscoffensis]UTJ06010.1 MOSC domain-containing protein [Arcobacter roscoffensis]
MTIGKVINTFSAKKGQSGSPRPKVGNLNLIKDYGIEFDKFANKDLNSTVMIVGLPSYEIASKNSIVLQEGSLGENILFDFNPHDYDIGTQFKIGDSIIEVTQKCTICNHLVVFDNKLPVVVKDCRGLYCKIIKSGIIQKDMPVQKV